MKRSKPEDSESGGSSRNSDEEYGSNKRSYGEQDGQFDDEGEGDEEVDDGGEDGYEEDRVSDGEPDAQPADADENMEELEEEDAQDDGMQLVPKADTEDAKRLMRRMSSSPDDSGSSGDHSKTSFDDSRDNRKSMKPLQSSVRDHELPLRIAYEQLDELAANAEKVKSAIEKNRSVLNIQVKKSNSRYLRAAFAAWKLDVDWQKTKQRDIIRANVWQKKSLMLRAFKAWIRDHMAHGKVRRLEKSAAVIIQRHNLRRCWKAWVALIKEKLRNQEDYRKEKRLIKDLDSKYQEKICRRACNFMYRWRLRRKFLAFQDGCDMSRWQGRCEEGIKKCLAKKKLKRLYQGWKKVTEASNNLRALLQARLRKRTLWQSFKAWQSFVGDERNRAEFVDGLSQKSSKTVLAEAFAAWVGLVHERKASGENLRQVTISAGKKMTKHAFDAFVDGCFESKRRSNIQKRAMTKMQSWRLNKAFQDWICYMQIQAQKKMVRLQEHVVSVEKENDKLRNENQRLAHVVDSGNWGKERVSELVQAGQVLTGERDALTRLLGRMQRQHSFALDQQRQHEVEVQELKRQVMGKKHLIRNKLLVKGASSFNSLVKAMKDDVLKNGNNPEVLYTIDKLAMDEVTVFPDGDLRVKAMTNFEKGKGDWPRHTSPGANPETPSAGSIQPSVTKSIRASTPTMKSIRPRTPLRTHSVDNEITAARPSSSGLSARPSPGAPRYMRARTPMRGRAVDHFDYGQKIQNSEPEPADGVVKGNHRDLGLHKRYATSRMV